MTMTDLRWAELMNDDNAQFTSEELAEGWHFCWDWDRLLVGPGMMEMDCCTCNGHKTTKNSSKEVILSKSIFIAAIIAAFAIATSAQANPNGEQPPAVSSAGQTDATTPMPATRPAALFVSYQVCEGGVCRVGARPLLGAPVRAVERSVLRVRRVVSARPVRRVFGWRPLRRVFGRGC